MGKYLGSDTVIQLQSRGWTPDSWPRPFSPKGSHLAHQLKNKLSLKAHTKLRTFHILSPSASFKGFDSNCLLVTSEQPLSHPFGE